MRHVPTSRARQVVVAVVAVGCSFPSITRHSRPVMYLPFNDHVLKLIDYFDRCSSCKTYEFFVFLGVSAFCPLILSKSFDDGTPDQKETASEKTEGVFARYFLGLCTWAETTFANTWSKKRLTYQSELSASLLCTEPSFTIAKIRLNCSYLSVAEQTSLI